ncbi:hypothetical protein Aperf_G00000117685 [Anoplocephala perfoliata]
MRKFYKKNNEPLEYLPGVTIIKTLNGVDPLLSENIISHMELRYPNFEILFCVEDPCDPAIQLVESLLRKYPNVDARLIIGGKGNITNPLVNNFLSGYEAAKFDFVWFSSSRIKVIISFHKFQINWLTRRGFYYLVSGSINVTVRLCALKNISCVRLFGDFDFSSFSLTSKHGYHDRSCPKVGEFKRGVVHQIPFICDQRGFVNAIEKVYFGCVLSRNAIALNQLGVPFFIGMSYVLRKSILDKFGGIAPFGKFLSEDYFLSKELFENGYKIVFSAYPAQQNVANVTLNIYVSRLVRWMRLRLNMVTIVACLIEPMIECVNLGFLLALSLNYLFGFYIRTTMAVHIVVWMTLDYFLLRCVQGGPLPFSVLKFVFAWWARELITYWVYVKAVLHPRTAKWGKNTFHLFFGGQAELLRGSSSADSTENSGIANGSKSVNLVSLVANEVTPTVPQVKSAAPPKTSEGIAKATNLGIS